MCYIIFVTSNALAVTHCGRSHGGPRDDGVGGAVKGALRRDADGNALDMGRRRRAFVKKYTILYSVIDCALEENFLQVSGVVLKGRGGGKVYN